MMYRNDAACAKKINTQFQRLKQHYSKIDKYLNGLNYAIISENEINEWLYGADHKSPVLLLNTSIYNWENPDWQFVNRGLQREIDYNLLAANEGYFEYIKNTFANQWDFVKKFDASISLYINDNDQANRIYRKLHDPPEKFTKEEFRTAIEIDLISIFECAETLYLKYDKEYNRYFKESEFLRKQITNLNYIDLDYGERNADAIKFMHLWLKDLKFIECALDEFERHFDPFSISVPKPMVWLGSVAQLLVLMMGKDFQNDNDNLPKGYYQLKFKTAMTHEKILANFKLKDSTTTRTLAANYGNIFKRKRVIKSKSVKLLIHDLKLLAKR